MKKKIAILFLLVTILWVSFVQADDMDEEEIDISEEIVQASGNQIEEPNLNSRAAVVMDRKTRKVLFGKEENTKRPMASTTKIMTAIVVIEKGNLSDVVEVSKKAAGVGGSRLGLKKGDKVIVKDLLYGLMLKSGNDSAVALAEHVGGSIEGFAELMNQKAKELGLNNSHFVTPHGLDMEQHYTTAYELAQMGDYALKNKVFAEIVGTRDYTVFLNGNAKNLSNTNELLGNLNGVYGVKTGFTNGANRCLVTSVKRDNLDIITVVLGADTKKFRTADSVKIIEYAYKNYKMIKAKDKIIEEFSQWKEINEKRITVNKGISSTLNLELGDCPYDWIPIHNQEEKDLKVDIDCLSYLEAPIEKGQNVGNVTLSTNKGKILTVPIVVKEEIRKKNVFDYFTFLLGNQKEYLEKCML